MAGGHLADFCDMHVLIFSKMSHQLEHGVVELAAGGIFCRTPDSPEEAISFMFFYLMEGASRFATIVCIFAGDGFILIVPRYVVGGKEISRWALGFTAGGAG